MSIAPVRVPLAVYDVYQDALFAELYDRTMTSQQDDIAFLQTLVSSAPQVIFEGCCGTGRLAIPLAMAGHHVRGVDSGRAMLDRAEARATTLPADVRGRLSLELAGLFDRPWPTGNTVVVFAAGLLWELNQRALQEDCIRRASQALDAGGHLFIDLQNITTRDMTVGFEHNRSIAGVSDSGAYGEAGSRVIDIDHDARTVRYDHYWIRPAPDGGHERLEFVTSRRLPTRDEIAGWLAQHGFSTVQMFGDRDGSPYHPTSARAIFWATRD